MAQKISERTPRISGRLEGLSREHRSQRVERAGAYVPENDADRTNNEGGGRLL
jgi:hypothetical protein